MGREEGFPRFRLCGDSAVSVEFGSGVDSDLHARVMLLDAAIAELDMPGVVEAVPTYRSLLVHTDPELVDHKALAATLRALMSRPVRRSVSACRWRVPVVYGGAFGEDLAQLAAEREISEEEFVRIHAAAEYTVVMTGFMPGFAYLGGMDPRLAAPRRPEPRPRVPAGSIAIGGVQSSIGSVEAPSGWHLIGRTPVRCFQPGREPLFLFEAGHVVEFEPVPEGAWAELVAVAEAGDLVARRIES